MRKIIYQLTFVITAMMFLSGCAAFHGGYMSNSASLSSPNFSYLKKNISGKASASYVFGIGGLGKKTLVDEAKKKMLASYSLEDNQALANLTVNFKSSYIFGFIFSRVTCTVTADVVEFNNQE